LPSVISPRKRIEVALPLDAINTAAAREKSIRHGHPSGEGRRCFRQGQG
jgi:putative DNA methylase